MLDSQGLEEEGRTVKLLSSEQILNRRSPHYKHLIKGVYRTDAIKHKIAEEKQGTEAYKSSNYQTRPIDYKPEN